MPVPPCCRCIYTPSGGVPARGLENTSLRILESLHHPPSLPFPPPWPTPGQPGGAGMCFISTMRVIASASKIETCLNQSDHSHVPGKLALLKENKGRNASQPGKADSFRAGSFQELISRTISSSAGCRQGGGSGRGCGCARVCVSQLFHNSWLTVLS